MTPKGFNMKDDLKISLNGDWLVDYISSDPYDSIIEPSSGEAELDENAESLTVCPVPAYWEDLIELFKTTALHTKLSWNPLYTRQSYPQAGYVPDTALPYPYGSFIYKRSFDCEYAESGISCKLYFGGVQNTVSVWINGEYIGRHEGYSSSFSFQIPTGILRKENNVITLAVSNNRLSGYLGRPVSGLTSRAANECTGGIYGNVELRFIPDGLCDAWVITSADFSEFTVYTEGAVDVLRTVKIFDGKKLLLTSEILPGERSVTLERGTLELWSPDSPKLYTLSVESPHQTMTRRFGIRRLTSRGTKLYLNGKPYYFRGSCEHCYHPLTVHPTKNISYYRGVIKTLKELGFNSLRFHTYVPMEEYMQAADEGGMLIEIETPNNTSFDEWCDIMRMTRRYTSPMIYSSGNEMVIDEEYIEHLRKCADMIHSETDSLFSPMSAMRGIEYHSFGDCELAEPIRHNPKRLKALGEFCDLYNSYSLGLTSYESDTGDAKEIDRRNSIYKKPLLTHEICIGGTYIDLSLKDRYRGTAIGETELFSSVEKHLEKKGLLDRAPIYYKASVGWQSTLRKSCFELCRRSESFAGYDFLGDIDTHWHTFGYCVGMMNEFYELKLGETRENVLRYNSPAVLLADLPKTPNIKSGEKIEIPLLISNFSEPIERATLMIRISNGVNVCLRKTIHVSDIPMGELTQLYTLAYRAPTVNKPTRLKLSVSISGGNTDAKNEWDIYVFPSVKNTKKFNTGADITVCNDISPNELIKKMRNGERVLIFGAGPFARIKTSFQISLAGRTNGHLATVISDHEITRDIPSDGYCGVQFRDMLNCGYSVILDKTDIPFAPIIEIASAYKNARREALVFEYCIGNGRLLVSALGLSDSDPFAAWWKNKLVEYVSSDEFDPDISIRESDLIELMGLESIDDGKNQNAAINKNDVTMN